MKRATPVGRGSSTSSVCSPVFSASGSGYSPLPDLDAGSSVPNGQRQLRAVTLQHLDQQSLEHQGTSLGLWWKSRAVVARCYVSTPFQVVVAVLILVNFFVQCLQRQMDPSMGGEPRKSQHGQLWHVVRDFWNWVWLVELLIHVYGLWTWPDWLRVAWNQFDVVVVAVGITDLCGFHYAGPLKLLRLFRIFRIFRLFGRVESLQTMMDAIGKSIPGVLNVGVILLILVSMYAVLAVDVWGVVYRDVSLGPHCGEGNCLLPASCDLDGPVSLTKRGLCFGWEYYGTFVRASYTMFQIMTGESWSEIAVRPILFYFDMSRPWEQLLILLFFLSYVLLSSFVLMNVMVTVLLDKFSETADSPGVGDNPDDPKALLYVEFARMRTSLFEELDCLQTSVDELTRELQR